MPANIRLAEPKDIPQMEDLFREAGRTAWPHILPPAALDDINPPKRWADAVHAQDGFVYVAEANGRVVGFVVARASQDSDTKADTAEIDSFYTHPDVWGQGFGRELLQAALESLRAKGFMQATLWTAEQNHRPRLVYERAGWKTDGATRHRSHLGAEFIEVRYRLAL